jgi:hypothetical protein
MRDYFGLMDAKDLFLAVNLEDDCGASEEVRRIIRSRLEDAGLSVRNLADDPRTARSHLSVEVDSERRSSRLNSYGRVRLSLRFLTGPGRGIEKDVELLGPYRLSRVTALDAVINSLLAIEPEVYRQVLRSLDETWQADLRTKGLSYFVAELPAGHRGADAVRVLELLSVNVDGYQRRGFDTPPMIARELHRYLADSPYGFSLDPLTGEIRIVYNGDT